MRILALDLATQCGYALGDTNVTLPSGERKIIAAGSWDLKPRTGDSPGMRFVNLAGRLNDLDRAYAGIDLVVYEQAHHRGAAATQIGHGLAATVQAWCASREPRRVEHTTVHSSTLKKLITGKGNASKDEMLAAIRRRFPNASATDDDEADALAVFLWACERRFA